MSFRKILNLAKEILQAVIPVIRKETKVEDSVIVVLEVIVVILGLVLAF